MDKEKKVKRLDAEIRKVIEFIQKEISQIFINGEILNKHMYIALLGQLDIYFTKRWTKIITFTSSKPTESEEALNEILGNRGNQFLLDYDAETLCDNIWNTWLKIDSNEFRFEEAYVEELIDLLEERITEGA